MYVVKTIGEIEAGAAKPGATKFLVNIAGVQHIESAHRIG